MRTKLFFILVLMGILATGCSRKSAPTISLPTEQNPCDDRIQALLDSITEVEPVYIYETVYENGIEKTDTIRITDTSNCNYYKVAALDMAKKYNTALIQSEYQKLSFKFKWYATIRFRNEIELFSNSGFYWSFQ